jgi:hypothetical protein
MGRCEVQPRGAATWAFEKTKVFWFFFSKKNTSSFSEEKEAKRLLSSCLYQLQ